MLSGIYTDLAIYADRKNRQEKLVHDTRNKLAGSHAQEWLLNDSMSLVDRCLKEQTNVLQYIENLITSLLQAVHGEDYRFMFELVYKKDGSTLQGLRPLIAYRDVWDSHEEQGDGIQATCAIGFRAALLLLDRTLEPVMITDELAPSINEAYWPLIIKFFSDLWPDVPIQWLCVTHSAVDCFPKTYRVTLDKGLSQVVELGS